MSKEKITAGERGENITPQEIKNWEKLNRLLGKEIKIKEYPVVKLMYSRAVGYVPVKQTE